MNPMRRLFQRGGPTLDATADDTQTAVDIEAARQAPQSSIEPISLTATLGPAEQLRAFRQLVGISPEPEGAPSAPDGAPSAPDKGGSKSNTGSAGDGPRPASNVGMYARIIKSETSARRAFIAYSLIIDSCLGLQILVAAALTAMGAANTSHAAITALGAVNTVIAGFLTYLKGSGLPGRLKYYENAWRKVRESIEQRERDFCSAAMFGTPLPAGQTLEKAVADLESLYTDTRTEIEVNTPDNYTAYTKQGGGRTPQKPNTSNGGPTLPPGTSPDLLLPRRGDKLQHDLENERSSLKSPEKAPLAMGSSSADEAPHHDAELEPKPASPSAASG